MISLPTAALAALLPFAGKQDVRFYLNGVQVEPHPTSGGTVLVATDGYRMLALHLELPFLLERPVILPRDLVERIVKANPKGDDAIALEGQTLRSDLGGEAEAIDGKFPNWRQVIPHGLAVPEDWMGNSELIETVHKSAKALARGGLIGKYHQVELRAKSRAMVFRFGEANAPLVDAVGLVLGFRDTDKARSRGADIAGGLS